MKSHSNIEVGILGDGAMSKAIIHIITQNGFYAEVFSRKKGNVDGMTKCDILFLCIPSGVIAEYLDIIKNVPIVVSCSKGLSLGFSGKQEDFISKLFSSTQFCALAGPNFASEIITNAKTITTIASKNDEVLKTVSRIIANNNIDVETTHDVLGVEICGIIKNAMAIVMGYQSNITESWNEKSLVLTKCFQELSRVLTYFGCDKSTVELSCGIGDIYLTCSTSNSRNFKFGANFAKGVKNVEGTVEGVRSFKFIRNLPLEIPTLKGYAEMFFGDLD